ncbi:MAG: TIGR04282 family arsenosugar biosynthesis glycosyltransferase [Candidatus Electrothrix sp. GW3-4]|uniref:TIGR04282 family arsenosugar biosynthesis glycosyltransferase n=1 Tax=Candidatus Electrothrix sp. GW3-4 TaxID=3126740 RepID=UPI0030CE43F2
MNNNANITQPSVIVLFTRYPQAGKVKTRLIKRLGPQGAANLHSRLTKQVIRKLQPILESGSVQLQISYCGGAKQEIQTWLGKDFQLVRQQGHDLGERMRHAFEQVWQQEADRVLLIGSDCPGINPALLENGLERLKNHDVILGPASDGGYYLIGLSARLAPRRQDYVNLFHNIDWGSGRVLKQTLAQLQKSNLPFALLPELHDIDRPEDLIHLHYHTDPE